MRRGFKIFWLVVLAIAALLFAIVILMQTSAVQTFVTKKVLEGLEKNLGAKIEFSRIHLKPFNAIVLKNAAIIDPAPDTLEGEVLDTVARAETITATFSRKRVCT